jgi:EAL domain-containing protein (putative c-di-GMP-specific phosphodiesterase class I)
VPVAVNVSFRDLLDEQLARRLGERLRVHGVDPGLLTLEITERVLTADLDTARATLEQLSRLGVLVSLDDFGTGWSSLRLLRELPVAEIKIDRSFVSRVATVDEDRTVVRGLTAMAHELGMQVVAEGIETSVIWSTVAELGCDTAQGWHLSRPLPAAEATSWLAERLGGRQGGRQGERPGRRTGERAGRRTGERAVEWAAELAAERPAERVAATDGALASHP